MKRALVTFLAVVSLSIGVAGSIATVADARSNGQQDGSRGDGDHNNDHNKCDDDRGKSSTPKACDDDHRGGGDHGGGDHGGGDHGGGGGRED